MRHREPWPDKLLRLQKRILSSKPGVTIEERPVVKSRNKAWPSSPLLVELHRIDSGYFSRYTEIRRGMDILWDLVSKPLKFPARRRRQDREIPKAA